MSLFEQTDDTCLGARSQMLLKIIVYSILLRLMKEFKEDYMIVGESKAGVGLHIVKITYSLKDNLLLKEGSEKVVKY